MRRDDADDLLIQDLVHDTYRLTRERDAAQSDREALQSILSVALEQLHRLTRTVKKQRAVLERFMGLPAAPIQLSDPPAIVADIDLPSEMLRARDIPWGGH